MTLRDIAIALGFVVDQKSVGAAENTISNIKNFAMKALGAIAIGFSFSALNSIAEEFNGINDKIKAATKGMGDQEDIQQRILKAANDTKSSYSDMAGFVTQLIKQDNGLFGDLEAATQFAGLTTKVLKNAGRADAEISSAQAVLNKAFTEGTVSGATFAKMLESYPEMVNAMADGLGVTKGQLSSMAEAGRLTSKTLVDAFTGAAGTINSDFDELDYSISDAVTNIRNSWGLFVNDLWVGSGITNGIGRMMVKAFNGFLDVLRKLQPYIERLIRFLLNGVQWAMDMIFRVSAFIGRLVNKVGGLEKALKLAGIAAGAVWLAVNAGKVLDFLKKAKNLLSVVHSKVFAMAAAVVILALLIEDLINFMQGNDSVIGTLFDKAGIDADGMRQKIKTILGNLEAFFTGLWNAMKEAAAPILEAIQRMLENIFGEDLFAGLGEGIAGVIGFLEKITAALAGNTGLQEFLGKAVVAVIAVVTALKGAVPVVKTVVSIFKIVSSVVKGAGAVIGFITSPVGVTVAAIAALIAIGILLYKNWDKVKEFAIRIWTSISEFFQGVWEGIVNFFVTAWDAIKSLFETALAAIKAVWEAIWNGIKSFFEGIWNGIASFVAGIWDAITGIISGAINGIYNFIVSILTAIKNFFSNIFGGIADSVGNIFSNILGGITGTIGNIKDAIVGGLTTAIDWVRGIPSQALQWGKDIVGGIADGVKGAVGKVTDAVSGIANKIKSFLHFSVPDEGPLTDYEDWMPDFMGGLAKGIQGSKDILLSKVRSVAGSISALMQGATVRASTVANGAVNSTSHTTVTQNNTFNNSYSGSDMQAQQNVSKGMNKSAQDATSYMAKGLAYAR